MLMIIKMLVRVGRESQGIKEEVMLRISDENVDFILA